MTDYIMTVKLYLQTRRLHHKGRITGHRTTNGKRVFDRFSLTFYTRHSKMVDCAVTLDTSFAQFRNHEYRTVNKAMLLNSTYIIASRTNVNKRLTVK